MKQTCTLGLMLALVFGVGACTQEVQSDPMDKDDATARRLSLPEAVSTEPSTETYSTHLYSEHDADVYSRMPDWDGSGSGVPVVAIHVEVGRRVSAGQLLATLEDDVAKLQVELARPATMETRRQLERVRALADGGVVTEAELDAKDFANQRAEASLREAELYLERTRIRAPFAGVVSRRYVREREVVDEETPLFRVTALAPLRARLLVPEHQAERFTRGADVALEGSLGEIGMARVVIIGPTIDPGSGTREIIVELTAVDAFRPGAAVTARLTGEADLAAGTDDS